MNWREVDLNKLIINDLNIEKQLSLRDYLVNLDKEKRKEWYKQNSKYRNELKAQKYKENPEFKKNVYKKASITKTGMHYNMSTESKLIRNKKISIKYQNKTEEEKQLYRQKISTSQKERYSRFSEEDKKRNSQIHHDCLVNRTYEQKLQTSLKLSKVWHNKSIEERKLIKEKISLANKLTWNKKSSEEIRTILANHVKSAKNNITDDGKRFDSSYEKDFYNYFLNLNVPLKHNIPIEYFYKNLNRRTYIDFQLQDLLFECKGYHLLKGVFDYKGIPIETKLNVYKNNNVILVTDTQGLEYCKNHKIDLNVITIDLFRSNINWDIIFNIIKGGGMNVI